MYRRLYLLESGQTVHSIKKHSFNLELTDRAVIRVRQVRDYLDEKSISPDLIFCSKAKNAKQSFRIIKTAFEKRPVFYPDFLYFSSEYALLELLHKIGDEYKKVFVIGHTEPLSGLLRIILNPKLISRHLPNGLPVGGFISVKSSNLSAWRKIEEQILVIDDFFY